MISKYVRLISMFWVFALFSVSWMFLSSCDSDGSSSSAPPRMIHHELRIRIFPEEHRIAGTDEITLPAMAPALKNEPLVFSLSANIRLIEVLVNGKKVRARRDNGRIVLPAASILKNSDIKLIFRYEGIFNDSVPIMPVNTDNPGYGVWGTISERGVFLLGGAGWYPATEGFDAFFHLEVTAPAGMVAVTAGRSLGSRTENGMSVSRWEIPRAAEPIALSAGSYDVQQTEVGKITAATYLFAQSRELSREYLAAVTRFIEFYQDLFGPYPFEKFAVVENFFPTGYGFPSYTLMGTEVLHLPFIKSTSLGHEIAHCWWGNGVGIDFSGGNWSEGLTTYVSDYLFQERESAARAADYRRQLLRNYAAVVRPGNDVPLDIFISRTDPVSKVIGYDKCAMVFHMLRREVGDQAFWAALRRIYETYLFKKVSWNEIREVFEKIHEGSLKSFFEQWLERPGAVQLFLDDVTSTRTDGHYHVSGTLRQHGPLYEITVPVAVVAGTGETRSVIDLKGKSTSFDIELGSDLPKQMTIDPDADVFRKLHPSEIPPSINSLKSADGAVMVVAETVPGGMEQARLLAAALGLKAADVVPENRLTLEMTRKNNLIFLGTPQNSALLKKIPGNILPGRDAFTVGNQTFLRDHHALFVVFPHPDAENRVAALFVTPDATADILLRKIPHYGKYSFLVFKDDRNIDKGTWPVTSSPLIHYF